MFFYSVCCCSMHLALGNLLMLIKHVGLFNDSGLRAEVGFDWVLWLVENYRNTVVCRCALNQTGRTKRFGKPNIVASLVITGKHFPCAFLPIACSCTWAKDRHIWEVGEVLRKSWLISLLKREYLFISPCCRWLHCIELLGGLAN